MKKDLVVVALITSVVAMLCICSGCATTPEAIRTISAVELQMWDTVAADVEDIVNSYDAERKHWTDIAFKQMVNTIERKQMNTDGVVNLKKYKDALSQTIAQKAAVEAQYANDKADVLSAVMTRIRKAKYLQMLLNEYEQSTGVAPETLEALITEVSDVSTTIMEAARREDEVSAADSRQTVDWEDMFNAILNGVYDRVYNRVKNATAAPMPAALPEGYVPLE